MQPFEQHAQIVRHASDAAFHYTIATLNASLEATDRALALWSQIARDFDPGLDPKHTCQDTPNFFSTSGARSDGPTGAAFDAFSPFGWPNPFVDALAAFWGIETPLGGKARCGRYGPSQSCSPLAWWAWWPHSSQPAVWPWAYGMMSAGVPGSVAWPMAQANLAAAEASLRAAEAFGFKLSPSLATDGFAWAARWSLNPSEGASTAHVAPPLLFAFWPISIQTHWR